MEERTHLGLACAAELRDVADEALHDRAMAVGAVTVVRLGAARPLDVLCARRLQLIVEPVILRCHEQVLVQSILARPRRHRILEVGHEALEHAALAGWHAVAFTARRHDGLARLVDLAVAVHALALDLRLIEESVAALRLQPFGPALALLQRVAKAREHRAIAGLDLAAKLVLIVEARLPRLPVQMDVLRACQNALLENGLARGRLRGKEIGVGRVCVCV